MLWYILWMYLEERLWNVHYFWKTHPLDIFFISRYILSKPWNDVHWLSVLSDKEMILIWYKVIPVSNKKHSRNVPRMYLNPKRYGTTRDVLCIRWYIPRTYWRDILWLFFRQNAVVVGTSLVPSPKHDHHIGTFPREIRVVLSIIYLCVLLT